jgi:hypothetical protein
MDALVSLVVFEHRRRHPHDLAHALCLWPKRLKTQETSEKGRALTYSFFGEGNTNEGEWLHGWCLVLIDSARNSPQCPQWYPQ